MKKLFLILCLTTATINAMKQDDANAYIKALRDINENAAALAMKKNPTSDDIADLLAQEGSVEERYKNLGLDHNTLHSKNASLAATINELRVSITEYTTMIETKMNKN